MTIADAPTLLLGLLNLLVGVLGAYFRLALRDINRRLGAIEECHREHLSWHMDQKQR